MKWLEVSNGSFSSWDKQLESPDELINLERETTTEKCIFQVEPNRIINVYHKGWYVLNTKMHNT